MFAFIEKTDFNKKLLPEDPMFNRYKDKIVMVIHPQMKECFIFICFDDESNYIIKKGDNGFHYVAVNNEKIPILSPEVFSRYIIERVDFDLVTDKEASLQIIDLGD